jgi:hypothetical protein
MAITELLTAQTEPVPSTTDVLALNDGSIDTYWQQFGDLSSEDGRRIAERNQKKQQDLTTRLYQLAAHTGNHFVDTLSAGDVAKEWYLGLGSLNKLESGSAAMMLAAATLWEQPTNSQALDPNMTSRFVTEVGAIRRGQTPERMRSALFNTEKMANMSLAGQVMLDIARIPEQEHVKERLFAADVSFQVNHGLTEMLSEQPNLDSAQKRILSDALKTKYDAKFEFLLLKRQSGELSDEDYEETYTQVLDEQVHDTLGAANKMTNGDLLENYFVTLMRYALNTWQGQLHYEVRATTRRQDEPHDGFAVRRLPKFAYDATVTDRTGSKAEQLVQLKTSEDQEALPYAKGIALIKDILIPETSNVEMRKELMTGLSQMRGLIVEVVGGQFYEGKDDVIRRHVAKVRRSLGL